MLLEKKSFLEGNFFQIAQAAELCLGSLRLCATLPHFQLLFAYHSNGGTAIGHSDSFHHKTEAAEDNPKKLSILRPCVPLSSVNKGLLSIYFMSHFGLLLAFHLADCKLSTTLYSLSSVSLSVSWIFPFSSTILNIQHLLK